MTINQVASAFAEGRSAKGPYYHTDGIAYYLHGSRIAWREGDSHPEGVPRIIASFCGYYGPTTLNHLKAIAAAFQGNTRFGYSPERRPSKDPFILAPVDGATARHSTL